MFYDGLYSGLFCRLREVGGGIQQSRLNWIDEVCGLYAVERSPHLIEVEEVP